MNLFNTSSTIIKTYQDSLQIYFSYIPFSTLETLALQIYRTNPFSKRKKLCKQYLPTITSLKAPFKQIILERNKLAQSKSFSNYLEFILASDKIPQTKFKLFEKHVDGIITYCNQNLPKIDSLPRHFFSSLNSPCLLCRLPFPEFNFPDEIIDRVLDTHPIVKAYKKILPYAMLLLEKMPEWMSRKSL
ncbi:MAG: hypothetical protein ACOX6V_00855 [Patescibacteria group bacterium]|jgi:hypothetical protein